MIQQRECRAAQPGLNTFFKKRRKKQRRQHGGTVSSERRSSAISPAAVESGLIYSYLVADHYAVPLGNAEVVSQTPDEEIGNCLEAAVLRKPERPS